MELLDHLIWSFEIKNQYPTQWHIGMRSNNSEEGPPSTWVMYYNNIQWPAPAPDENYTKQLDELYESDIIPVPQKIRS